MEKYNEIVDDIVRNIYPKRNRAKKLLELQKSAIFDLYRDIDSEESHISYANMILHYTRKPSYIWDEDGLKKLLLRSYVENNPKKGNLLRHVVTIDPSMETDYQIKAFRLPTASYLRLYAGGNSKEKKALAEQLLFELSALVEDKEIETLCSEYKINKVEYEAFDNQYKKRVKELGEALTQENIFNLKTGVGTYKFVSEKTQYDIDKIATSKIFDLKKNDFVSADEFFLQCPIKKENIEKVIDKGWINPASVDSFKAIDPNTEVSNGFEIIEESANQERRAHFFEKNVRRGENLYKYDNLA